MPDCTSTWTTVGCSYGGGDLFLRCWDRDELRLFGGPTTLDRLSIEVDRVDSAFSYRIDVQGSGLAGTQNSIVLRAGMAATSDPINVFVPDRDAIRVRIVRLQGPGFMDLPLPFSKIEVRVMGYTGERAEFDESGEGGGGTTTLWT